MPEFCWGPHNEMVAGAFSTRHHVVIHYVVTYCFCWLWPQLILLALAPLIFYWLWPLLTLLALAPIYVEGQLGPKTIF